jgi:predicted DNA-binding transcriptional regulator AlpA|tara:strand:- start:1300 stop:1782 length:483 start_codon:yes stop_codon:yes gene_type:complete
MKTMGVNQKPLNADSVNMWNYHHPVPRNDAEMLSVTQVATVTGFGQSTIYRKARGAGFPSPQTVWAAAQDGARRLQLRWDAEEINAWMETQTNPGRTRRTHTRKKGRKTQVRALKTADHELYNWKKELAVGLPAALLGAGALGVILGLLSQTILRWLGAN